MTCTPLNDLMPVSLAATLIVTLATGPEPDETLRAFCRKVNPGGMWGPYRPEHGARPVMGWSFIVCWGGGIALIYGGMFALGYALFGLWYECALASGAAAAGALTLWRGLGPVLDEFAASEAA